MTVTKTDLDAADIGMTVEDCDGDIWGKNPSNTWVILDSAGNPVPIAHTARFLADHCSPLTVIGVSERLQTYYANQGVQKAAEAAREPLPSLMPIETDDLLHRQGDDRPKRIAIAKIVGYSWESIAQCHGLSVDEAKDECREFLKKWMEEL